MSWKSQQRQGLIAFIFVNMIQYPPHPEQHKICHSNKREPPPFFNCTSILGHVLVHSVDKTHVLVVAAELIWLFFLNIFFSTLFQHRTNLLRSQDSEEAMLIALLSIQPTTVKVPLLFCLMCAVQSGHVPFFLQYLPPTIVHLRNLFLLNTRVARMLLVSKRKDVKQLSINISKLTVVVKHAISRGITFSPNLMVRKGAGDRGFLIYSSIYSNKLPYLQLIKVLVYGKSPPKIHEKCCLNQAFSKNLEKYV